MSAYQWLLLAEIQLKYCGSVVADVKVWRVCVDGVERSVRGGRSDTHGGVISQACQNRQIIAHGPGQRE